MYDQNPSRTGAQALERTLSPANASFLQPIWSSPYKVSGPIAGSVAVANGTAFFGSWNGNVSALNVSGTAPSLAWPTSFQTASHPMNWIENNTPMGCFDPANSGVTSTPAIWNNLVVVGTGDPRHATGKTYLGYGWVVAINVSGSNPGKPLWETNLSVTNTGFWRGTYVWSSPVVYKGNVYIGLASGCDQPLVQGQLYELSGSTGSVLHTFNVVNTGQTGGGILSSPSIDARNNTVWFTTGNPCVGCTNEPKSQSIVAL
ncbi:MAG: PQQ-binding-like beta-propeller repeat protein, partial [Thermoplasmata archaeon]|nr:PQQ-binding-like beta-propeller repeat protein [Thermoplasmata archaeon]